MDDGAHEDRRKGTGARDTRPRRVARAVGRTCIGTGLLLLLFVGYQLLGTNLVEARSQHDLRQDFAAPPAPAASPALAPPPGEAVAVVRIPRIGVDKAVVEGVGVTDLRKGPGHYPGTPLPGQPGNAAIAGHRTTYGAPFFRLDEVRPGDDIEVTTRQGDFHYRVEGSRVVRPEQVEVLGATSDSRLTLTTCNPRFSARQRLVVSAVLVSAPAAPAPTSAPAVAPSAPGTVGEGSLGGRRSARLTAAAWALLAAAVGLATWALGRAWRRWPAYLLGALPFLAVLFVCFEHVSRLLPANF